jgi:hypothetical protein
LALEPTKYRPRTIEQWPPTRRTRSSRPAHMPSPIAPSNSSCASPCSSALDSRRRLDQAVDSKRRGRVGAFQRPPGWRTSSRDLPTSTRRCSSPSGTPHPIRGDAAENRRRTLRALDCKHPRSARSLQPVDDADRGERERDRREAHELSPEVPRCRRPRDRTRGSRKVAIFCRVWPALHAIQECGEHPTRTITARRRLVFEFLGRRLRRCNSRVTNSPSDQA